jgi:hypothetical protein
MPRKTATDYETSEVEEFETVQGEGEDGDATEETVGEPASDSDRLAAVEGKLRHLERIYGFPLETDPEPVADTDAE